MDKRKRNSRSTDSHPYSKRKVLPYAIIAHSRSMSMATSESPSMLISLCARKHLSEFKRRHLGNVSRSLPVPGTRSW